MLWIAFLLVTLAVGFLFLSAFRAKLAGLEKLCVALTAGFALTAAGSFCLALLFGLPWGAYLFAVLAVALVAWSWKRVDWSLSIAPVPLVAFILVLAASFLMCGRIHFDEVDGGWVAGATVFGDLMYHSTVASSFAYGNNFPAQEIVYAGEPLRYHLFTDFYTAELMALGLDLRWAMVAVNALFTAMLAALLYYASQRIVPGKWAGAAAAVLVLFSGGIAVWQGYHAGMDFPQLSRAVYDLYHGTYGMVNVLLTVWAQRVLLTGLCVFLAALALVFDGINWTAGKGDDDYRLVAAGGVLTGLCLLTNFYVFAAAWLILPFAVLIAARSRIKGLAAFVVPAFLLALPALPLVLSHTAGYPKVNMFWMSDSLEQSLVKWVAELGFFLPLLIAGLALTTGRNRLFYLAPLAIVVLINVFQFQPNEGDNHKFIVVWLVASAPLAGLVFQRMAEQGRVSATLAVLLLALASVTGIMNVAFEWDTRYTQVQPTYFAFADYLKANTDPHAVFVTDPSHVHPVTSLAGRPIVEGPYAWTYPHGYDYGTREADVRAIYAGAPNAAELLEKYHARYVVLGPLEAGMDANEAFLDGPAFNKTFDAELNGSRWRLYEFRQWNAS